jgi:hypothetical protein
VDSDLTQTRVSSVGEGMLIGVWTAVLSPGVKGVPSENLKDETIVRAQKIRLGG